MREMGIKHQLGQLLLAHIFLFNDIAFNLGFTTEKGE